MTDREKVIKGMEVCNIPGIGGCDDCPYLGKGLCQQLLAEDVIALLKLQEPRVMTYDEAMNSCVIEYRSGNMRRVAERVLSGVNGSAELYGIIYRVWDTMPTDEQRRDTPWKD